MLLKYQCCLKRMRSYLNYNIMEERSKIDGCHCGADTVIYRTVKTDKKITVYHKCSVCASRFRDVDLVILQKAKSVPLHVIDSRFR